MYTHVPPGKHRRSQQQQRSSSSSAAISMQQQQTTSEQQQAVLNPQISPYFQNIKPSSKTNPGTTTPRHHLLDPNNILSSAQV